MPKYPVFHLEYAIQLKMSRITKVSKSAKTAKSTVIGMA